MNTALYIAKRYLVSKKSHNIINIISMVSVVGITVGTMALIIVLSVFNGFEQMVSSLFNAFDPDLKVEINEGKTFSYSAFPYTQIKALDGVAQLSAIVEEDALLKYNDKQHLATIKGVSNDFARMSGIDTMLVDGDFILQKRGTPYAVMGLGSAINLSVNLADYTESLSVYVPNRKANLGVNFDQAFRSANIYPAGIFSIQQDIDYQYILVPIDFARQLLDYTDEASSVAIMLEAGSSTEALQSQIEQLLGPAYTVKNRYQQQQVVYQIMKAEKWAIFLILTFILIIASFNMIGSLSMLILDKKKDIEILGSMGADRRLLRRIFFSEGFLIAFLGAIGGLFLGGVVCWLQQHFGLIKLQGGDGAFIIDAYPVLMQGWDFLYVFLTVCVIGALAAGFTVRQIGNSQANQQQ